MTETNIASIAIAIDQKTISATVERIVLQEIASKLGEPAAYFDKVIKSCVQQRVDRDGRPSSSSYDTMTMIEYTAVKAVQAFVGTIVDGWLASNRVTLEKAIAKSLASNVGTMAKVMADHAVRGTTWGKIGITITPPKND